MHLILIWDYQVTYCVIEQLIAIIQQITSITLIIITELSSTLLIAGHKSLWITFFPLLTFTIKLKAFARIAIITTQPTFATRFLFIFIFLIPFWSNLIIINSSYQTAFVGQVAIFWFIPPFPFSYLAQWSTLSSPIP